MTDPIIRKINALSKSFNRLQSSRTVSYVPSLIYASFTSTEVQYTIPNGLIFLKWGYQIISDVGNDSASDTFGFIESESMIYIPLSGYYNLNVNIATDIIPGRVIAYLYMDDLIFQSTTQQGQSTNGFSFSFSFFAEQNAMIQIAIKTNINVTILSTEPTVDIPASPMLNIVKIS